MNRAHFALAATLVSGCLAAGTVFAQTQATPDPLTTPILAGKKFTPPFKGQADVDFTKPVTKRDKELVITTIQVKNMANGPLARLTVDETWYDKSGGMIPGGKGVINGLLQPGEVQTVKIETRFDPKMSSNNWNFSHAQGTIKPHLVKSFDAKDAAATPAAPAKPAAKSSATKKK